MSKKIVVAALLCLPIAGFAQSITGGGIASQFNSWEVAGSSNLVVGANPRVRFMPCMVQGDPNHTFPAVSANAPLWIRDPGNPSIDEVVTPTSIVVGSDCTATITTVNAHTTPYYFVSGTYGLQEAINSTLQTGVMNTITLSPAWHYAGGTAATIYAAAGSPYLTLDDTVAKPNASYRWSGTHYVPSFSLLGTTAPTLAAGAAAGTGPTVSNSVASSGNVMTANVTTGTATTTGTFFTETVATAAVGGVLNCTVQSVGGNAPPPFTVSTTNTVLTVTATTAPTVSTPYIFGIACN